MLNFLLVVIVILLIGVNAQLARCTNILLGTHLNHADGVKAIYTAIIEIREKLR